MTSVYLSCREKMGSNLLVETSRNPDCPKVRLRRWPDASYLVTDSELSRSGNVSGDIDPPPDRKREMLSTGRKKRAKVVLISNQVA